MAFWKQIVVCLVLFAGAFLAWLHYDAGALARLKGYGIDSPLLAAIAPQDKRADSKPGETSGKGSPVRQAALVVTEPVGHATLNDHVKAIGSGMAIRTATITSVDSGRIETVEAEAGDHLDAGQVIATLDSRAEKIAADQARLTLKDAKEKLARYKALKRSAAVTAVELSNQESAVAADKLALEKAEYDLSKRSIRAPIAGVIGIVDVNVGDYVTTQTKISTIDDRSKLRIDFQVPERFVGAVKVGQEVNATASAFPGRTFKGRVSAIDNRIDPDSRTLRVRAVLPNRDDLLRAGMSFLVTLKFPGDRYPSVNPLSVQWDSNGAYIWKVHDGKAERVAIQVVQRNPQRVLVDGEIESGDQVVTQGVGVLRAGSDVRVADNDEATGSAPAPETRRESHSRASEPPSNEQARATGESAAL